VAIIDTGVEKEHPSIVNNIIGGYNFTKDDNADPLVFKDRGMVKIKVTLLLIIN
jgi:major intracellular serine protease